MILQSGPQATSTSEALSRAARRRNRLRRTAILKSISATSGLVSSLAVDFMPGCMTLDSNLLVGVPDVLPDPKAIGTVETLLGCLQPSSLRADAPPFEPYCQDLPFARKGIRCEQTAEALPEVFLPPRSGIQISEMEGASSVLRDFISELIVAVCSSEDMSSISQLLLAPTFFGDAGDSCIDQDPKGSASIQLTADSEQGMSACEIDRAASVQKDSSAISTCANQDVAEIEPISDAVSACDDKGDPSASASQDLSASSAAVTSQGLPASAISMCQDLSASIGVMSDLLWGDDAWHDHLCQALGTYLAPQFQPAGGGSVEAVGYLPEYVRHLIGQERLWSVEAIRHGYEEAMNEYRNCFNDGAEIDEVSSSDSEQSYEQGF